ncbi:MAG: hypothetical protein ACRCR2_02365 [Fusobacteriaceae bacterium]
MKWIPIADWPGYFVSKEGQVLGRAGKVLKPQVKRGTGVLQVTLCKGHLRLNAKVCDLVADAFIPNPMGYTQVLHKDGNRANCTSDNLVRA